MCKTVKVSAYCGCYVGEPKWRQGIDWYKEPDTCEWEGIVEVDKDYWEGGVASCKCPQCGMELLQDMEHFELVTDDITNQKPASKDIVDCEECGGSGFSGQGTGYDSVCDNCGGKGEYVVNEEKMTYEETIDAVNESLALGYSIKEAINMVGDSGDADEKALEELHHDLEYGVD